MNKNYLSVFIKTIGTAGAFLFINYVLYLLPQLKGQDAAFTYPLWGVYLFFLIFSLVILGVLIKVSQKNLAQVGYAFLLLTGAKMAASYFLAKPIIAKTVEFPTEKANFFAVFVLFLAIEAYFTARLLNNKQ
ncbi:MAG: hypothetical protein V4581_08010 [Bacteroidota bacterium]